jgi:hypothetical protein
MHQYISEVAPFRGFWSDVCLNGTARQAPRPRRCGWNFRIISQRIALALQGEVHEVPAHLLFEVERFQDTRGDNRV